MAVDQLASRRAIEQQKQSTAIKAQPIARQDASAIGLWIPYILALF